MWRKTIDFELLEMLGEGGQGSVYRALRRDRASGLEQFVAIKILHSKTTVDLWRQEFESLSRVRSPYCVQVLSFERFHRRPALVLEFVDGVSLAQLGQTCWLTDSDIDELVAQLEHALKDLHANGIFHGDLSPQNILLDRSGRVRVLDFGLANCNADRSRATPRFASPERLRGDVASVSDDLFALGKVEQFLRGEACSSPSYLHQDPAQRKFQDLSPCAEHRAQLGQRIEALLSRRKFNGALKTRTQLIQGQRPWTLKGFVLGSITSLMMLATSSASQIHSSKNFAILNIRTSKWHYFLLNGHPIGYSPFSLPVEGGETYRLEWISAQGRGSKAVVLKAREARSLEDRDFSH